MSIYYNGKDFPINYMAREKEYIGVDLGSIGYSSDDIYDLWKDGLEYAKEIQESWDTSNACTFDDDHRLVFMPLIDNNSYKFSFKNCSNLVTLPVLNTSNVTSMYGCFSGCSSLTTIPQLDTSNVTRMGNCFYSCSSLTIIPQLDTSNVTNMEGCFYGCSNLTTIPELNTSNVTTISSCFRGCSNLTTIPELDTSNVTTMNSCFEGCSNLLSIPELNTSKVTNMSYCFQNCSELTTIPELDTSNVTSIGACFYGCSKLKRIEGISFKSMGNISSGNFLFGYNSNLSCRYLLIKDMGTNSSCTTLDTTYARVWGINDEDNPDARQSLIDSLLTYSFDRASAGYSNCTIKLYSTVKALLTEEEINQIQAKGYIIS